MKLFRTSAVATICLSVGLAAACSRGAESTAPAVNDQVPTTTPPATTEPAAAAPGATQSAPHTLTKATPAPASAGKPAPAPAAGQAPAAAPAQATAPAAAQAAAPAKAPEPTFEEFIVSANTALALTVDHAVSSEDAQVEDKVSATITRDVRVGDRVAIPAGARATGVVASVERGGKVKERARLGLRFTQITLGNGTRVAINTEVVQKEGASAAKESAAKIGGGAIGGAIIGGIIGGKKGAAIGTTVGGGAGTAAVMAGGRNAAVFESGEALSVSLTKPATVTLTK